MKTAALLFGLLISLTAFSAEPGAFANRDERLQALVNDVVATTLKEFAAKKLQSNQLAVTLVDLRDAQQPRLASYRGGTPIYPASVVKLFYLAAAHRWMEDA